MATGQWPSLAAPNTYVRSPYDGTVTSLRVRCDRNNTSFAPGAITQFMVRFTERETGTLLAYTYLPAELVNPGTSSEVTITTPMKIRQGLHYDCLITDSGNIGSPPMDLAFRHWTFIGQLTYIAPLFPLNSKVQFILANYAEDFGHFSQYPPGSLTFFEDRPLVYMGGTSRYMYADEDAFLTGEEVVPPWLSTAQ